MLNKNLPHDNKDLIAYAKMQVYLMVKVILIMHNIIVKILMEKFIWVKWNVGMEIAMTDLFVLKIFMTLLV